MATEFVWEDKEDYFGRQYRKAIVPNAGLRVARNISASRTTAISYSWIVLFGGVKVESRSPVATWEEAQSEAEYMYHVVMAGRQALEEAKQDG